MTPDFTPNPARPRLGPGAEFDLIRRFLPHAPRLGREDVAVGPGDDCAVLAGSGIALSVDLSIEGIHFRRDWLSAHEIGCRATSAALSDLAAVAARPVGVLISLAVSEDDADAFAVQVMEGVRSAVERVGGVVLGGDLTRSPGPAVLDITVVGEAKNPVLRSGARPGDEVWVTGALGAAAVTIVRLLRNEVPHPSAADRFACPLPRLAEAQWLAGRELATAMIDLSDGLAGDAGHLMSASGVSILLDRSAIPIHEAVFEDTAGEEDALSYALGGGEDYELCFTAPPTSVQPQADEFEEEFGIALTRVGVVEKGEGLFWLEQDGSRTVLEMGGFDHFRAAPED
ncbi:MAG TPA: thiamine-phosphate kinase [Longimicrobiaceae bacterium]|nr:thiamine-phosphate kinase [Longimicrobiaceae bacterium]